MDEEMDFFVRSKQKDLEKAMNKATLILDKNKTLKAVFDSFNLNPIFAEDKGDTVTFGYSIGIFPNQLLILLYFQNSELFNLNCKLTKSNEDIITTQVVNIRPNNIDQCLDYLSCTISGFKENKNFLLLSYKDMYMKKKYVETGDAVESTDPVKAEDTIEVKEDNEDSKVEVVVNPEWDAKKVVK
jgi:hypothetical protein